MIKEIYFLKKSAIILVVDTMNKNFITILLYYTNMLFNK